MSIASILISLANANEPVPTKHQSTGLIMSENSAYQSIRVAIALLIGIVVTLVIWIFLSTIFASMLPEKPPVEDAVATTGAVILVIAAAAISSIIGGYITTLIAPNFRLAGSLLLGIALIMLFEPLAREAAPFPTWARITLIVVFIPAAVFGGLVRIRSNTAPNESRTAP
jgi:hypothetical protein